MFGCWLLEGIWYSNECESKSQTAGWHLPFLLIAKERRRKVLTKKTKLVLSFALLFNDIHMDVYVFSDQYSFPGDQGFFFPLN